MNHIKLKLSAFSIFISLILTSCVSTKTALYDHYSYQKTTELKVETSKLMSETNTPYLTHKEPVEKLLLDFEKLMEYEKNKPNNEITFEMWKMLTNKEKNLLAGFFKNWETKGTLSTSFSEESKKQILEALDLLIQYEIKKDKESKDELLNLIQQ